MVKRSIFLACVAFASLGCIQSPLLNHVNADEQSSVTAQSLKDENPACPLSFEKQSLCASLTWIKQPSDDEKGQFQIRFWQKASAGAQNGPYVDPGLTVAVKLWMPAMGHGSSPVTIAATKDSSGVVVPGVYDVTDVYFVMGGDWEIWIQLKQGKQIIDQAKKDIEI